MSVKRRRPRGSVKALDSIVGAEVDVGGGSVRREEGCCVVDVSVGRGDETSSSAIVAISTFSSCSSRSRNFFVDVPVRLGVSFDVVDDAADETGNRSIATINSRIHHHASASSNVETEVTMVEKASRS